MTQHLTPDAAPPPDRSRSGTTYMVVGTLLAAIAAYLFQLVAGRVLGPEGLAPIVVLWTVQFLLFTIVFMPMEQLTIRRLSAGVASAAPWRLFLTLIVVSTAGAVAYAALTLDRQFDGEPWYLVVMALLILAYGGFALGRGFLAGRRRFREYGLAVLIESVLRLALAVALLAVGIGPLGLSWTLVVGGLVVWLWNPLRGERRQEAGHAREEGSGGPLAAFVTANASAQTLVAAGPLAVSALGGSDAAQSILFMTFLLFRSPLTVSYSLIARILPPFTRLAEQGATAAIRRWALRFAGAGALLGVAAYGVGLTIGADVVELMFGAEFRPSAQMAALAAAGSTLATVVLFEQQLLIALRATRRMAAAWLVALAVAVAVIVPDGAEVTVRVSRAFLAGEVTALIGLTVAILRR